MKKKVIVSYSFVVLGVALMAFAFLSIPVFSSFAKTLVQSHAFWHLLNKLLGGALVKAGIIQIIGTICVVAGGVGIYFSKRRK